MWVGCGPMVRATVRYVSASDLISRFNLRLRGLAFYRTEWDDTVSETYAKLGMPGSRTIADAINVPLTRCAIGLARGHPSGRPEPVYAKPGAAVTAGVQ